MVNGQELLKRVQIMEQGRKDKKRSILYEG